MSRTGRVVAGGAGAAAAGACYLVLTRLDQAGRFSRTNHRGDAVTLLEGPAAACAALLTVAATPALPSRVRRAGVLAGAAAAVLGGWDDVAGSSDARGVRGHLGALRRGEVTTGALKVLGIGASGMAAGALLHPDPLDAVLAAGVVAGTANLVNLLDLRPGRAGKAVLALSAPALLRPDGAAGDLLAGPAGVVAALLVPDLRERSMLGDCGANTLGALVGVAIAAGARRRGLALHLAGLLALTAASERVSFTKVIESTPGLREIDALGRRPPPR